MTRGIATMQSGSPGGSDAEAKENWLNLPNAISFARLCAAPFALAFIVRRQESYFEALLVAALLSDFADGLIARWFKLTTRFGARLDTLADDLTFAVGAFGVYAFKYELLRPDMGWLYAFVGAWVLSDAVPYLKFRKMPAFHLYSFKAVGYLVALNFLLLFTVGYVRSVFIGTALLGCLASAETIVLALILKEYRTDVGGLYRVLAERRDRRP